MSTPSKDPPGMEDSTVYGSALENLSLSTSFLSDSGKIWIFYFFPDLIM